MKTGTNQVQEAESRVAIWEAESRAIWAAEDSEMIYV